MCQASLRPHPVSVILLKDSHDLHTVAFTTTTYDSQRIQSKITQRKGYMGQRPKETRHKLSRVPSQRSHTEHLIPPAQNCDTYQVLSTREACLSLRIQGLYQGPDTQALCPACTKISTPRRKPYCLYQQFWLSEPLLYVREFRNPPETQVPRCQPKPTLKAGLSKQAFQRIAAMLTLLCIVSNTMAETWGET